MDILLKYKIQENKNNNIKSEITVEKVDNYQQQQTSIKSIVKWMKVK